MLMLNADGEGANRNIQKNLNTLYVNVEPNIYSTYSKETPDLNTLYVNVELCMYPLSSALF